MKKLTILLLLLSSLLIAQHDSSIVFLGDIDSTIITDVRYATTNNFTGKVLYPTSKVYIRNVVGKALANAHQYLQANYNLRIKIFDGFRPLSVQKQMWKIFPDPNYVADPSKGSRHNRGAAVDITIIDSTGVQLDMGTEYDNFTERAHYAYPDLPEKVKKNRKLLHDTMIKFGFEPIDTEWWHFDYHGWKNFSILDYTFN